jgi:two-component sensor histidine kinase
MVAYLLLLVAVSIIPTIIFCVILLQRNNQAQQKVLSTLAQATAASMSEAVDREITGMVTTLRLLSTAPSLFGDDLQPFYERTRRALAGTGAYLTLADSGYNQLFNTRARLGEPLGRVSDPDSVAVAVEKRSPVVSDLFFDQAAGNWVFNVALPVFPESGSPRVLILTRNAESLSQTLVRQTLSDGWQATLVDGRNAVIASTSRNTQLGGPFFLDLISRGPSPSGAITAVRDGVQYEAVVSGSGLSGWSIVMWASLTAIEGPLRHALWSLTLGGLIMIALGIGAALLLTRQISGPVRHLARDARRLGKGQMVAAVNHPITEFATVSIALAHAAQRRKESENEIRFLMREVAHRSKNQLTVVSSLAKQSARSARSVQSFQDGFQKRLHGLARSTDLLIAGGVLGVELRELLAAQIEPFRPDKPERLEMNGPEFRLGNQAAQTIGMALHELATNAAKYGAFAREEGRLAIVWRLRGETLELVWREHVRRLRKLPERRGFGTEIIERMLAGALSAKVERHQHGDGLEWRFEIPLAQLRPAVDPGSEG